MKATTACLTALSTIALLTGGCSGGDDASGEGTTTTVEEAVGGPTTGTDGEDSSIGDTDPQPAEATSIEELEAQWADRRAEIVAELSSDDYGVGDDGVLRGPGGFEVDLGACPAEWSDTEGVGDTIRIAYVLPQTGPLSTTADLGEGIQVYFDQVNASGGINGTPVELIVRDDGYDQTRTVGVTDELLAEGVLAISNFGSDPARAVYGALNEQCVPQPFSATGHRALGDPENHPWTTGHPFVNDLEPVLWGTWIERNLADELPVDVSALVFGNDFGEALQTSFQEWVDANPDVVSSFQAVSHDISASSVTDQLTEIRAAGPDVLILMTAGIFCSTALTDAEELGLADSIPTRFLPTVCENPSLLTPAGPAADGYLIAGGGTKATTEDRYADDIYVSWANEQLQAAGKDPAVAYYGVGFAEYGWSYVEALRIAAELPGGLTRSNLILAVRSLDLDHPAVLDGISYSMRGVEDAYLIEGSEFSRFDAESGTWRLFGEVIDLDGTVPNCPWSDSGC
jgi:ABC-type branched-subunit amino acid transport system substrate-binding protein